MGHFTNRLSAFLLSLGRSIRRLLRRLDAGRPLAATSRGEIGRLAEREAVRYLTQRGYRILERNFHCPRGEIDLIAFRNGVVVFVEVKCRTHPIGLDPLRTVNAAKQRRIVLAARHYAAVRELHREPIDLRFDVIAIRRTPEGTIDEIEHIENAFNAHR